MRLWGIFQSRFFVAGPRAETQYGFLDYEQNRYSALKQSSLSLACAAGIMELDMPTLGIEEEVFVTEPERPTLRSFYYLARLLAKNPSFYYTHSAHNFARGKDLKQGWISGVEISTGVHENVGELVDDLAARRADLSSVASGLIVPIGHLINYDAPTNTCAIHVHIGGVRNKRRVYENLLHFMPILPLFTANSPFAASEYFGKSYRMSCSFAIGPVQPDWSVRFQDIIYSRRLGTIELRVCDPCWNLERIRNLLNAVKAIAELEIDLEPNIERYNSLRERICREGLLDETAGLVSELKSIADFPADIVEKTASDELAQLYNSGGILAAYSALDSGYRCGKFEPKAVIEKQQSHIAAGLIGFAGYFVPRLPYYAWKGIVENGKGSG